MTAIPFVPAGGWPRRIGMLEPVGALKLSSSDPAFGGFSALAIRRGHMTLLSDGGNIVRLHIRAGALVVDEAGNLSDGPGDGWEKKTRDTESLALDPATGTAWIGYEAVNAIWRYTPDFSRATAHRAPRDMAKWGANTGPESLIRLNDGRFLTIREGRQRDPTPRAALLFLGDPALPHTPVRALRYAAPPGAAPSDAAVLPDGDVLVLNRRWHFPLRFEGIVTRIARADIRPGALLRGRVVAHLSGELAGENPEGLAVTREGGTTIVWIVTDNDGAFYRPTILAKFRLSAAR
ncbi:esterase-like activity of phytase family protein [Sphingomonas sp.]|uniref:esterase-like activity of phytase family protein n=1 Tax=Sphingomonas sp. TaxID=28214 RepID=UPI0035C8207B